LNSFFVRLPIPETIPFRLTRDIIDGLGICGTEGLFKK
jgi:ataxia telangiectasia mutated family protein